MSERNINEYDSMAAGFDAAAGKYDKPVYVKVIFSNICPVCGREDSYSAKMNVMAGSPTVITTANPCKRCAR